MKKKSYKKGGMYQYGGTTPPPMGLEPTGGFQVNRPVITPMIPQGPAMTNTGPAQTPAVKAPQTPQEMRDAIKVAKLQAKLDQVQAPGYREDRADRRAAIVNNALNTTSRALEVASQAASTRNDFRGMQRGGSVDLSDLFVQKIRGKKK
jgi:hypothetical protein